MFRFLAAAASSKRRRTLDASAPVNLTLPGIVSGWGTLNLAGYSTPFTLAGLTLVAQTGTWSSAGGAPTVRGYWFDITTGAQVGSDNVTSYTVPALSGGPQNYQRLVWRETATRSGKSTTVSTAFHVRANTVPNAPPYLLSVPSTSCSGTAVAGAAVTKPSPGVTWADPLSGIAGFPASPTAGQWYKNNTATGVATSTYSSVAEGDDVQWGETASNLSGSATWKSDRFYISTIGSQLAADSRASVLELIEGKAGGAANMNVFSAYDHDAGTYTRNTNLWCHSLMSQLVGVTVFNKSTEGYQTRGGGVLITPRHLLHCEHFHPWASGMWPPFPEVEWDARRRFVRMDNTYTDAIQISQFAWPVTHPGGYQDFSVVTLDRVVPDSIPRIRILSLTMAQLSVLQAKGAVFFGISQKAPAGTSPPSQPNSIPRFHESMVYIKTGGNAAPFAGYDYNLWPGDSGTPGFLLFEGQVYLYQINTSSNFTGPKPGSISSGSIAYINDLIARSDAVAIAAGRLADPTGYTVVPVTLD